MNLTIILELYSELGVKLLNSEEYEQSKGLKGHGIFRSRGMYDYIFDCIVVNYENNDTEEKLCGILLHELIHWTGHKNRLNRFNEETVYKYADHDAWRAFYHTEEAIAQIGLFYLGLQLGFDRDYLNKVVRYYLKMFPKANIEKAKIEANKTIAFINNALDYKKQIA